jgi:gamma-glutamyltranspeptidase/glutathione hydrolase
MKYWSNCFSGGVIVTKKTRRKTKGVPRNLSSIQRFKSVLSQSYKENDTIKYPALAATLKRIAKMDVMNFTKGKLQKTSTVPSVKGGIITMEDLDNTVLSGEQH